MTQLYIVPTTLIGANGRLFVGFGTQIGPSIWWGGGGEGGEVVKLKPLIKPLPGGIRKSSRSNACIQAVTVPTTVQYNVIGDVADPITNICF